MKLERIVKRFYDELDEGRMMGRKCTRCGAVEFPPVLCCNTCGCMDMEWVEISGKAELTNIVMPGTLSTLQHLKQMGAHCFGNIRLEEGTEFNGVVFGVTKKNYPELLKNLPVPVRAEIVQMDGYKTVMFRLIEE